MALLTIVGSGIQPDAWHYFPPNDNRTDYFAYRFDETLISAMLDAGEMTVAVPYAADPSTVTFAVAGLSEHIDEPSDVCDGS